MADERAKAEHEEPESGEDDTAVLACPFCSHVVMTVDSGGCILPDAEGLSECQHYVGSTDEDGYGPMNTGFEPILDARRRLIEYLYEQDGDFEVLRDRLREHPKALALVDTLDYGQELSMADWLSLLPEVQFTNTRWDGGGMGANGEMFDVFMETAGREELLATLTVICDSVEALLDQPAKQMRRKPRASNGSAGRRGHQG